MSKGLLLRIVGVVAHFADDSEYFRLGCLTLKKNQLLKSLIFMVNVLKSYKVLRYPYLKRRQI